MIHLPSMLPPSAILLAFSNKHLNSFKTLHCSLPTITNPKTEVTSRRSLNLLHQHLKFCCLIKQLSTSSGMCSSSLLNQMQRGMSN